MASEPQEGEDLILVVGPGRCGTSSVARVLHERLGVNMGLAGFTDEEHYEDRDIVGANRALLKGEVRMLSFMNWWKDEVRRRKEPWGAKDPMFCYTLPLILALTPEVAVVRCRRSIDLVVTSWMKNQRELIDEHGGTQEQIRGEIEGRERLLDNVLHDGMATTVHFGEGHYEEEHLAWSLKELGPVEIPA